MGLLDQAKRVGEQGGTMSTRGMPSQTAQKVDATVNATKGGK